MKLFVSGVSGLLGLNVAMLSRSRFQVSGSYYSHTVASDGLAAVPMDATLPGHLERFLRELQPDAIIHTAGLTNVEECEANPELACRLNVDAAQNVARAAALLGAKLVHLSSDHLFDGELPLRSETDPPKLLNVYAKTKWQAEQVVAQACPDVLIVRTNFFGWGTSIRRSFSDWILQALEQSRDLTMFTDIFFTPILMNDLVELIFQLVNRGASGIFHVAGGERLSKYDFALKLAKHFGCDTNRIFPISVQGFPFKAKRPRDMSLACRKTEDLLGNRMPAVSEGLDRLKALREQGWPEALEQAVSFRPPSQMPDRNA
jgi:dTDP-4-dehydrorhamnose reductase